MKKVIFLIIICLSISVFGLGSDALAYLRTGDVKNTEWEIKGTSKLQNCERNYLGSMIGAIGLAQFFHPSEGGMGVVGPVMVSTGLETEAQLITGTVAVYHLKRYRIINDQNKITATMGNVCMTFPDNTIQEYPKGACADPGVFGRMNALFKVAANGRSFTGSIRYVEGRCNNPDAEGYPFTGFINLITVSGKKLGKFSTVEP